MDIAAYLTIPAYETITGEPVDVMRMFDRRYEGRFILGTDARPVLVVGGQAYDAATWTNRLDAVAAKVTVGRTPDADGEAIRAAGWPLVETFAAEDRELRPEDLYERRQRLGVTQVDLAGKLGVSANTIACWERGDKPIGNPRMLDLALQTLERLSV
jgi:DNA-binding transcriptional regulator YiaG